MVGFGAPGRGTLKVESLSVRPVGTSEALALTLRGRIFGGEIPPGTRLPELDLVAEYGVARATVREALQRLVHQGVLQRKPNHSAEVPELTPAAVADIFCARLPLELHAVRSVIERKIEVPEARVAVTRLQALSDDAHWSEVVDADVEFHRALMTAVGSPRLSRLHSSLEAEIRLCIAQLRPAWHTPAALADEHCQVLDGILAGSVSAAEQRMREHLEKAVRDLSVRARERI